MMMPGTTRGNRRRSLVALTLREYKDFLRTLRYTEEQVQKGWDKGTPEAIQRRGSPVRRPKGWSMGRRSGSPSQRPRRAPGVALLRSRSADAW